MKTKTAGDLNTQEDNDGSGNTWGDTADTNEHDARGSKTIHTGHGNTIQRARAQIDINN